MNIYEYTQINIRIHVTLSDGLNSLFVLIVHHAAGIHEVQRGSVEGRPVTGGEVDGSHQRNLAAADNKLCEHSVNV